MWWRGQQRQQVRSALEAVSSYPLGLVEVMGSYCVDELGAIYFYVPKPRTQSHQAAWAWLEVLRIVDVVRSGPYRHRANDLRDRLEATHPRLFDGNPIHFDIYRIDRDRLPELVDFLRREGD